jgi:hypothetical protein
MPDSFAKLFRLHQDPIIRRMVDEIYRDRRTELPERLPVGQLVEQYPDMLDELGRLLDGRASEGEIADSVRGLRVFAQTRFHAGILIDEVARELMLIRKTLNEFLWRDEVFVAQDNGWELREALERVNRFVDEMVAQTVIVYAASWRPPVETRTSIWPPPRRRK